MAGTAGEKPGFMHRASRDLLVPETLDEDPEKRCEGETRALFLQSSRVRKQIAGLLVVLGSISSSPSRKSCVRSIFTRFLAISGHLWHHLLLIKAKNQCQVRTSSQ